MGNQISHAVDPDIIKPGQHVRYDCPEPDCTRHFWHTWIPTDAVTTFGDPQCRLHGDKRVFMQITGVADAPDS